MKSPRILIVEDELDIRLTLETTLKTEGYEVITASLGNEAIDLAKEKKPDLMLLDIMMPDIDGYEVCRMIKQDEVTSHIVVVFASALRKTRDKVEGLNIGADDYITKPFNIPELLAKLRVHFRIMEYQRKLEALVEFAHSVNALSYEAMADALKRDLSTLITAERFSIFLFDESEDRLELLVHNHGDDTLAELEIPIAASPIMNKAYEKMDGVLERNFEKSDYSTGKQRSKYKDGFAYCMPLKTGAQFLGVLNLNGNSQGFFDRKEFHFVALIAEILSASIRNVKQLEIQKKLAVTDGLTGLLNHRSFQERLNMEYDRASRFKNPLSCVMVDIDFFKKVNDTHGHPIGDAILRGLAARLKKYLRKVDTVARYGGEEFAMLLPQTEIWAAQVVAERIRADVEALPFETSAGPIKVTISLGISDTHAESVSTCEELLKKSDEGLYRAKSEGRNRTVVNEG